MGPRIGEFQTLQHGCKLSHKIMGPSPVLRFPPLPHHEPAVRRG